MLPKINQPLFEFVRPSNDEKIKFRPFNAKEEKILLMARQGKSVLNIYDTVLQIVNNCIVSDKEVDITTWPTFDVELLFVRLRAKSINEELDVKYSPDKEGPSYEAVISLEEAYINITDDQKKKKYRTIMLDNSVGVVMKWPCFKQLAEFAFYCKGVADNEIIATETELLDKSFKFFADCIENVFVGEKVLTIGKDFTEEEILTFVSEMPSDKYAELQKFVEKVPTLVYKGKYFAEKGVLKDFEVKGFINFFTY